MRKSKASHRRILLSLAVLAAGAAVQAQPFTTVTSTTIASESASIGALSISRQSLSSRAPSTQALPRVFAPTLPRAVYTKYPWKMDIVGTVFWIGEGSTQNNPTPNHSSSWDTQWQSSFGGFDDPDPAKRAPDYRPAGFTPKQNPFYVALPYNDCVNSSRTKSEAPKVIPWFKQLFKEDGKSVCRDHWVAVRYGDRICYAQWSDCGPFVTDDVSYVFGEARPTNKQNGGAGIDLSPAMRDYLGFKSGERCDWRFVDVHEVPDGPWKSYGSNNHFVNQAGKDKDMLASRLDELRRQRDEWFKKNGNSAYQSR
jgi:hypothetical protein